MVKMTLLKLTGELQAIHHSKTCKTLEISLLTLPPLPAKPGAALWWAANKSSKKRSQESNGEHTSGTGSPEYLTTIPSCCLPFFHSLQQMEIDSLRTSIWPTDPALAGLQVVINKAICKGGDK